MAGLTGAEYLAGQLKSETATTWFGLPGSQFLPLLDLVHSDPELRFVTTRHEQGAAYMAYGWARGGGGLGVCMSTVGPGATNLLSGVAAAYKGRVPMLAYTAKQSARYHGRDMFQEFDQVALYAPVTKYSAMPTSPVQLPVMVRNALRAAQSAPLGPAHLTVMPELLTATVDDDFPMDPSAYRLPGETLFSDADKHAWYATLGNVARPLIAAGENVYRDDWRAWQELQDLASAAGIPVVTSYHSPDAFPTAHPFGFGPMGPCGRPAANHLVRQADLIIDVGGALDFYSTRYDRSFVPPNVRIVQIVETQDRLGSAYPAYNALVGALRDSLKVLQHYVELMKPGSRAWEREIERAREIARSERQRMLALGAAPGRIHPEFLMATLSDVLAPDDIVVSDSGNAAVFLRGGLERSRPHSFVDTTNFSAVGSGLPVAIGVSAALRASDRRVVCVCGDGGFMLNLPELETAVRENFPVVVVVANDFGFGNVRSYQRAVYGDRRIGSDYSNPDFAALARAFGAEGYRVERPDEIAPAIQAALASGKTAVVDVLVDPDILCTPLHAAR